MRQISRAEAERRGGESEPPQFPPVEWTNPRTGMTLKVPRGIDPGWDRNPGNYDEHAPALRRHLGLHPHEKIRHARLYEESARRMGGAAAAKVLRRGRAAHLFDKGIDTRVLVSTVLSRGTYEGRDADTPWRRIWAEVGSIGWRIKRSGDQIDYTNRLTVAELKVQLGSNGAWEYHLIPRTKQRGKKDAPMAQIKWVEIWADLASGGLVLRVLRGLSDGRIELRNPHNKNKLLDTFTSYDDAELELNDDEFVLIEGRLEADAHDFADPDEDAARG